MILSRMPFVPVSMEMTKCCNGIFFFLPVDPAASLSFDPPGESEQNSSQATARCDQCAPGDSFICRGSEMKLFSLFAFALSADDVGSGARVCHFALPKAPCWADDQ